MAGWNHTSNPNKRNNVMFLVLVALSLILAPAIHPYGDKTTLNAGLAIGYTEQCQFGYEVRGEPGFFAYCK